MKDEPFPSGDLLQNSPYPGIRPDPAGHHECRFRRVMLTGKAPHRPFGAAGQSFGNRPFKRRRQIGNTGAAPFTFGHRLDLVEIGGSDGGLHPGKGKMAAGFVFKRPRQRKCLIIAKAGRRLDLWPARHTKPKDLCGFVKSLAGGVIQRRAIAGIFPRPGHRQELGMAAGYQQHQVRIGHPTREPGCQGMALEVIDGIKGNIPAKGDGLGRHRAHQHPADQPRPAGGGHRLEIPHPKAGFGQRPVHHLVDPRKMRPGGHFGYNPAMPGVILDLA